MGRLRTFIKSISKPFLNAGLRFYYRKPRKYHYQGIEVVVDPSVFPPQLTLSTKILLEFLNTLNLEDKDLLELGCGSGIISLYAKKLGARVTASDINEIALENLRKAASKNDLEVRVIHSNLFDRLANDTFHYIIINPPYYPKAPKNMKEKAWFCGENFEYFEDLFSQLPNYLSSDNETYLILSQDCDLKHIASIAQKNSIELDVVKTITKLGETNYIYQARL